MDIEQLKLELRRYTSEKRHAHSLNVMRAALQLAQRFAPGLGASAQLAGLLHDNAKRLSNEELLAGAMRFSLPVSIIEQQQPALLHGKVGAALLGERFGVHDPEVALAVADHVTGRPNMGPLSCVLYVADQMAADRSFPGVELLREVATRDLDAAVLLVARNKLLSVIQRGYLAEPDTVGLYNTQVMRGIRLPDEVGEVDGLD